MLQEVKEDPLIDSLRATQERHGKDYWSFKNASKRRGAHALIHYPAMMVPNLQGNILAAIQEVSPKSQRVLDPFVGSGTVLVESMNLGLDFTGVDINPLAVLSCLAKSGPYFVDAFADRAAKLISQIHADGITRHEATFFGRDKWFEAQVALGISKIARNVKEVDALWARRLFWLALARVIRTCCNSRNSTYKLHIKKAEDINAEADPIKAFVETIENYKKHLKDQAVDWAEKGLLMQGWYQKSVSITAGDSTSALEEAAQLFDVVMTSPPYGDNRTTIPYGQYAFLPLQWIPTEDISRSIDARVLANSHALDTASLGGSAKNAMERAEELRTEFESVKNYLAKLSSKGSGAKRFGAFFGDLEPCIEQICSSTNPGGYHAWTIGSRHIEGIRMPMEEILEEMLDKRGVHTVGRVHRSIHAKKMAARNNLSSTMNTEIIVLAKKSTKKK
ncbi:DNA methyltransferase [Hydrogenophaga laconesensis]|uniref:site-specific DNA-methyltransferase (cytosine-N(4)-specific) n=1 Tax=Hydrogenophaga laconesensis TaxID=1805971 RepID=A0ABU1V840_9BURK|nr:DNA methyltransferase [Hydrogenophaga laconesensis]MDR7093607.1 site-specific DNA-methyltransferase (cytosine-N4-specific) [Hydrogenophaga laconesensis]